MVTPPDEHAGRLLPRYLRNRKKDALAMLAHVRRADLDAVRRMAHNWKGTGTSFGADRISEIGAAIERSAKEGDRASCRRLLVEASLWLRAARVA